tara:strand:- start:38 stop:238 length:201 start_codon:yes stop_codon:yes gene_type:complete
LAVVAVVETLVLQVEQVALAVEELVETMLQDLQVQKTLAVVVAVVVQVDQDPKVVQVEKVFLQLKN